MIDSIFNKKQSCELLNEIVGFLVESRLHLRAFGTQKCIIFDEKIDSITSKQNTDLAKKFMFNDNFFESYISLILSYIKYDVDFVKIIRNASTLGESSWIWDGIIQNPKFSKLHAKKICHELYGVSDISNIAANQISSSIEEYGMNGPLFISTLASSGKLTTHEMKNYFKLFIHDYICTVDYTDNYLSENNPLNSYLQKINRYLSAYKSDEEFLASAISNVYQSTSELLAKGSRSDEVKKITRELEMCKALAEKLLYRSNLTPPTTTLPSKADVALLLKGPSIYHDNKELLLNAISLKLLNDEDLKSVIDRLLIAPDKFELDLIHDILLIYSHELIVNHIARKLWLCDQNFYEPFQDIYQKIDDLLSATKSVHHSVIIEMIEKGHVTDTRAKAVLGNITISENELVSIIDACEFVRKENSNLSAAKINSLKKTQYYAATNLAMGSVYPGIVKSLDISSDLMDKIIIIGTEHSQLTHFDLGMIDRFVGHSDYSIPLGKIEALAATCPDIYESLIGIDLKNKCNRQAPNLVPHHKKSQI